MSGGDGWQRLGIDLHRNASEVLHILVLIREECSECGSNHGPIMLCNVM